VKPRAAIRPESNRTRFIWSVAVLVLAAALLAGCGKKGDPKPPDPSSTFPETYPTE